jgi:biotin synthase
MAIERENAEFLYQLPFMELLHRAHEAHRAHHDPGNIERCTLLSIKTGGCPEDCSYCPQSAHYETGLERQNLLAVEEIRVAAKAAKAGGAQRFCMGAAWRKVKDGPEFERVLEMVRAVKAEGLEACVTLGRLSERQAQRLRDAGLDAYNHNLDTSREYYGKIIRTRNYDDRLETIRAIRKSGISVCSGGIIGMGENVSDRCALIAELASLEPQPESIPINLLIPVEGTPLGDFPPLDPLDLIRTIAVTRILVPEARVRLSAGRISLSKEAQVLAFYAGANSIFVGEKLLTRGNPAVDADEALLTALGSSARRSTV